MLCLHTDTAAEAQHDKALYKCPPLWRPYEVCTARFLCVCASTLDDLFMKCDFLFGGSPALKLNLTCSFAQSLDYTRTQTQCHSQSYFAVTLTPSICSTKKWCCLFLACEDLNPLSMLCTCFGGTRSFGTVCVFEPMLCVCVWVCAVTVAVPYFPIGLIPHTVPLPLLMTHTAAAYFHTGYTLLMSQCLCAISTYITYTAINFYALLSSGSGNIHASGCGPACVSNFSATSLLFVCLCVCLCGWSQSHWVTEWAHLFCGSINIVDAMCLQ